MGLKEDFEANAAHNEFTEVNQLVLMHKTDYSCNYYDFATKIMAVECAETTDRFGGSGKRSVSAIPFSQLDPEVLDFMRQKLTELGGKPQQAEKDYGDDMRRELALRRKFEG